MFRIISMFNKMFVPNKRKGTLALEEFDYNLSKYLADNKKSISNDDKRHLFDLFIRYRDKDIDDFLKSL